MQEVCISWSFPEGIHLSIYFQLWPLTTNPKHTHAFARPFILKTLPLLPIHWESVLLSHNLACQLLQLSFLYPLYMEFYPVLATQKSCEDPCPFLFLVISCTFHWLALLYIMFLFKLVHLTFVWKRSSEIHVPLAPREWYLLPLARVFKQGYQ